jgi:hypothetical protein
MARKAFSGFKGKAYKTFRTSFDQKVIDLGLYLARIFVFIVVFIAQRVSTLFKLNVLDQSADYLITLRFKIAPPKRITSLSERDL